MSLKVENEIDSHIAEGLECLLADAVRKHPVLYDGSQKYNLSTSTYASKHQAIWERISDDVNLEVESCKTLWTCIKQKFIKYRKRINSGEQVIKEWALYDSLHQWLDKHVKRRRTRNEMVKLRLPDTAGDTKPNVESANSAVIAAVIAQPLANEFELEFAEWNEENLNESSRMIRKRKRVVPSKAGPSKRLLKKEVNNVTTKNEDRLQSNNRRQPKLGSMDPLHTEMNTHATVSSAVDTEVDEKPIEIPNEASSNELMSPLLQSTLPQLNLDKLELVIGNCLRLTERCIAINTNPDSSEMFGKYIASLVRELPADKRTHVRFQILQFTNNIVGREMEDA